MRRKDSKGGKIEKSSKEKVHPKEVLSTIPDVPRRKNVDGAPKPYSARLRTVGTMLQMNTDVLRLTKRKSIYMANRHNKIARGASLAGVTAVSALARLCNINPTVCAKWLEKYPDFRKAFETGINTKAMEVEAALVKRALGYEYTTVVNRTEVDKVTGHKRKVKEVKTCHVPGDVAAQRIFLENRRTKRWTKSRGVPTKSMNVEIKLDATDDGL